METLTIDLKKKKSFEIGQQGDHNALCIHFINMKNVGTNKKYIYYTIDGIENCVPLTNDRFIVGYPLTAHSGIASAQLISKLNDNTIIKLSNVFAMHIKESKGYKDSGEYPVDPNIQSSYDLLDDLIDQTQDLINNYNYATLMEKLTQASSEATTSATTAKKCADELKSSTDFINTLDDKVAAQDSKIEKIEASTNHITTKQNTKIAALQTRMSEFTSLKDGSTTGDAELIDARIGADGTKYASAGDAMRGQVEQLNEVLTNQFYIQGWNVAPLQNFEQKMIKRDGSELDTYSALFEKAIHSGFIKFKTNKIRINIENGYSGRMHEFSSNQFGTQVTYTNIFAGIVDVDIDINKYYAFDVVHGHTMEDNTSWLKITPNECSNLRIFNISDKLSSLESIVDVGIDNIALKSDVNAINTKLNDSLIISGYSSLQIDKWEERPLSTSNGNVDNYEPARKKAIHSDFFNVKNKVRFYLNGNYQIRLFVYSNDRSYEKYLSINKTTDIDLDSSKFYRIALFNGNPDVALTLPDMTIDESENVKLFNITDRIQKLDELVASVTHNKYNTRNKIYGIRIDNSTGNVTRIADAIGLSNDYVVGDKFALNNGINDFDNIFPWSDMKLCNVKVENGIKNITYENEDGFILDGSNGDVMVEIPKFYTYRKVEANIEDICISGEKKSGFVIEPAFFDSESGKEIDYIYCGAYLSSVVEGKHTSITGTLPTTSKSLLEFRQCGEMYDFAMVQALQKLISIEFGKINLSADLGGLSYLIYPGDAKAYENVSNTNTCVFYSDDQGGASNIDNLFIGCNIAIGERGLLVDRKVTDLGDITVYTDISGNKLHRRSVTFSGSPVSVEKDVSLIYCGPNDNGLSDGMNYHTGRKGLTNISIADQFKYRGIEGLWGNVGEMMDGIRLKNLQYYISHNKNDYSDINKYRKLSYDSVEQNQYDFRKSFILKMGFDRRYPSVNLPCKISSSGDGNHNEFYGDILCANYLNGPDGEVYPEGTEFIGISSMAWDGNNRNGLYTVRFWEKETGSSILYGTRMIYRNI